MGESQDRRQLRRINQLIQACLREAGTAAGRPLGLLVTAHRMLLILACRYPYR